MDYLHFTDISHKTELRDPLFIRKFLDEVMEIFGSRD